MGKKRDKPKGVLADELRQQLQDRYPNLHVYERLTYVLVKGTFPVLVDGKVLDRYSVEIYVSPDNPDAWPIVREIGGRIPKTLDYHVYADGTACLFLPDEAHFQFPNGLTFAEFLEIPVRNYFLSQTTVANGGEWPLGYRSHDLEGFVEFYKEVLKTEDLIDVIKCLKCLAAECLKGHHQCPCGSGEIYRRCHQARLAPIRSHIKPTFATRFLKRLAERYNSLRQGTDEESQLAS